MQRTLIFNYKPGKLSSDVNVVLVFDPPKKAMLATEQNRVAWYGTLTYSTIVN